jgi:hypothetical protein
MPASSLPRLPALHALALAAGVVVAMMLGGGNGLPGLVWALSSADAHVCTCSSGGSHASCPVCNHALQAPSRSHRPSVDGLPCGDRRVAAAPVGQLATLPPALLELPSVDGRVAAAIAAPAAPADRHCEPVTPPPRSALPG